MNKKPTLVIGTVVALLLVFVVGAVLVREKRRQELDFLASENASTLVRPGGIMLGDEDARVYIVEFLDPGCETCAVLASHVKQMMADHPGKIRLVIRYAPFHHGADLMCLLLEASRAQGKYWETLQLMFDTQSIWASHHRPQPDRIWALLPQVGLDLDRLQADMNDPVLIARVHQDMTDARTLQVTKTPEFFVNGKRMSTFGVPQLTALVKEALAEQYD
jgi:protein-disulfide isomerase